MGDEQHVVVSSSSALVSYEESHYKLSEDIDYETWEKQGAILQSVHRSINWWIGDWILFGEKKFPEKCSQGVFITGKSEPTLRNCAWVCSIFPPEERVYSDLTFTHYLEVAGIKGKEERHWFLQKASDESLSALALRRLRADEVRIPPVVPLPESSTAVPELLQEAIEDFSSKLLKYPLSTDKETEVSISLPWGKLEMKFIKE